LAFEDETSIVPAKRLQCCYREASINML
jgi:hypothetical protein